jgi:AcrR family transcriptional regulator
MLENVGERGYEATTVPQVVATARVSRNAFYELFADKADCFIALCDDMRRELVDRMVAFGAQLDWVQALRSGVHDYLNWWADRPAFSRAYFVELPKAGERAIDQRERAYSQFRVIFEQLALRARREQPDLPSLPPLAPRLIVLAVTEVLAEEVRAKRTHQLGRLEDEIVFFGVKQLADDATAFAAVADGGRPRGRPTRARGRGGGPPPRVSLPRGRGAE